MLETQILPQVFSPEEVPQIPQYGSPEIAAELRELTQKAHQVVEQAFAVLPSDNQTEMRAQF